MIRREKIHARLQVICEKVIGVRRCWRNQLSLTETLRPAVVVVDGAEIPHVRGTDRDMRAPGPQEVALTVPIRIVAGNTSENVGTDMNLLLARVQVAVLGDAELQTYCTMYRYGGCSELQNGAGRQVESELTLLMVFVYPLKLTELAEE